MAHSLTTKYGRVTEYAEASHTFICRVDGVIALPPGAVNKLSIDEQLVGTLDLHIVGLNDNLHGQHVRTGIFGNPIIFVRATPTKCFPTKERHHNLGTFRITIFYDSFITAFNFHVIDKHEILVI